MLVRHRIGFVLAVPHTNLFFQFAGRGFRIPPFVFSVFVSVFPVIVFPGNTYSCGFPVICAVILIFGLGFTVQPGEFFAFPVRIDRIVHVVLLAVLFLLAVEHFPRFVVSGFVAVIIIGPGQFALAVEFGCLILFRIIFGGGCQVALHVIILGCIVLLDPAEHTVFIVLHGAVCLIERLFLVCDLSVLIPGIGAFVLRRCGNAVTIDLTGPLLETDIDIPVKADLVAGAIRPHAVRVFPGNNLVAAVVADHASVRVVDDSPAEGSVIVVVGILGGILPAALFVLFAGPGILIRLLAGIGVVPCVDAGTGPVLFVRHGGLGFRHFACAGTANRRAVGRVLVLRGGILICQDVIPVVFLCVRYRVGDIPAIRPGAGTVFSLFPGLSRFCRAPACMFTGGAVVLRIACVLSCP